MQEKLSWRKWKKKCIPGLMANPRGLFRHFFQLYCKCSNGFWWQTFFFPFLLLPPSWSSFIMNMFTAYFTATRRAPSARWKVNFPPVIFTTPAGVCFYMRSFDPRVCVFIGNSNRNIKLVLASSETSQCQVFSESSFFIILGLWTSLR